MAWLNGNLNWIWLPLVMVVFMAMMRRHGRGMSCCGGHGADSHRLHRTVHGSAATATGTAPLERGGPATGPVAPASTRHGCCH